MTPMLSQYLEIKEQNKDCILFYRVGDFYEMFFDDAILAAGLLDITLTQKTMGGEIGKAPLAGVPYHAAESYLAKLMAAGLKVAICDQVEDPALATGLVRREVTRILTPGTLTAGTMLDAGKTNYLASAYFKGSEIALAYVDISTGEAESLAIKADSRETLISYLLGELTRIDAAELLVSGSSAYPEEELESLADSIKKRTNIFTSVITEDGVDSAEEALFAYIRATQKKDLDYIKDFKPRASQVHMQLDKMTITNLELVESMWTREVKGSLLSIVDRTKTAMGARLLKKWIKEPLISVDAITERLDAVDTLLSEVLLRNNIGVGLKAVHDIERLCGRISYGNASAKDLVSLNGSLAAIPDIKDSLLTLSSTSSLLRDLDAEILPKEDIRDLIEAAITDEPPFSVKEGGLIRDGYSEELDELKRSISGGIDYIASLEAEERERTGIKSLKVRYNRVQGYYIEVTSSNLSMVPEDYVRKQTLANAERFFTPELKRVEGAVLSAEAKINSLENEIFLDILAQISLELESLRMTAAAIAVLDCLRSFAETAEKMRYVKPVVDASKDISIIRGRHPVIEHDLTESVFVPNDVHLDDKDDSLLLITGPNMAGKSTYMRQTALIVLMAQIGSFVPAQSAHIGITDRIFTRIGASDNISKGESTFFVEMNELSWIISNFTDRSLIILDEIGRGTSTYDGLSIAWAMIDYLCSSGHRARTLFATHYHELTSLEGSLPGLRNLSTLISESGADIVFLHKIALGASSRSYGIHVAKLAGLPSSILLDAQNKLSLLESSETAAHSVSSIEQTAQLSLFPSASEFSQCGSVEQSGQFSKIFDEMRVELLAVDINELTPSGAFGVIERLLRLIDE
ncbi:MAG: DNA mismatch repair protein MutS [Clostridiales Family XIII bacterium]|nr:DNA mismatch repair protein MutS [Clostridiales Family XIII bacterium]